MHAVLCVALQVHCVSGPVIQAKDTSTYRLEDAGMKPSSLVASLIKSR